MELEFILREAMEDDALPVLTIRNKKQVREMCFSDGEISEAEHLSWFAKTLANKNRWLLLACEKDSGMILGVIRYDRLPDQREVVEVSIFLNPKYFGRGLGQRLLSCGRVWLQQHAKGIKRIKAKIKADNLSSKKCFEKSGYMLDSFEYYQNI